MSDIWAKLKAPFPPDKISWRLGATKKDKSSGIALAYIDARDVMERLDETVGPENWECHYPHANTKTVCSIRIRVNGEWVAKSDGAGDSDVEAEKGALSDAFKRAAVRFGIGRYLYDLGNTWVELEERGNSHAIKQSEYKKLEATLVKLSSMMAARSANDAPRSTAVIDKPVTKEETRALKDVLCKEIEAFTSLLKLQDWAKSPENRQRKASLHPDFQDVVSNSYLDKQTELKEKVAA